MLLLFRVLELETGSLLIDGFDLAAMPLDVLRRAIAMLPQDPLLFSGSVRSNLDPFDEHTDSGIWDALERAQISPAIKAIAEGLDAEVGEGGDLFSLGQRQLLCFARALLKKSAILVMDECTASVDVETDAKIQTMVRQEFAQCTVLAIAHRIGTIIDYHQIVMLDKGKLVEHGSPAELLSNPSGHFSQLVDDTGSGHAVHLRELAVKAGEAQRAAAVGISRPVSPSHTRPASPDQWRGE